MTQWSSCEPSWSWVSNCLLPNHRWSPQSLHSAPDAHLAQEPSTPPPWRFRSARGRACARCAIFTQTTTESAKWFRWATMRSRRLSGPTEGNPVDATLASLHEVVVSNGEALGLVIRMLRDQAGTDNRGVTSNVLRKTSSIQWRNQEQPCPHVGTTAMTKRSDAVKASTASTCCHRGRRGARSGMFRFFSIKNVVCVFLPVYQ